ncbi:MAG: hypothetical protein ACT4NY_09155 [Pseudonocardiales bacterium]
MSEDIELECINSGDPDGCHGPVEYRMALSSTGESFPRCNTHWQIRLDTEDRLRRDYPDTPHAPDWFDPLNAGEHWNDDY